MKHLAARSAVLAVVTMTLGGCPNPVTLTEEVLQPSDYVTSIWYGIDCGGGFWCGGICDLLGQAPFAWPSPNGILVGFADYYDGGTEPFPCSQKDDQSLYAAVRFDLSTFDNIFSARLAFGNDWSSKSGPGTTADSAAARLSTATENWLKYTGGQKGGIIKWLYFGGQDTKLLDLSHGDHAFNMDVSIIVNDWARGVEPNYGFILWPDYSGWPEDNEHWVSQYSGFTLTVTYNPAVNPRHH